MDANKPQSAVVISKADFIMWGRMNSASFVITTGMGGNMVPVTKCILELNDLPDMIVIPVTPVAVKGDVQIEGAGKEASEASGAGEAKQA